MEEEYKLQTNVLTEFDEYLETEGYAYRTCEAYLYYIDQMLAKRPKISIKKIRRYLAKNHNNIRLSAVKAFVLFLAEHKQIEFPPFKYPRLIRRESARKVPLSEKEFDDLLGLLLIDKHDNFRKYDFRLPVKMLYYCALRCGEMVLLKFEDISFQSWFKDKTKWGSIRIPKETSKSKRERFVPVPPFLMKELEAYAEEREGNKVYDIKPTDYFFDFNLAKRKRRWNKKLNEGRGEDEKRLSYNPEAIIQMYTHVIKSRLDHTLTAISKDHMHRPLSTHLFRASRATYWSREGLPIETIKELLGHRNIETTMKYIIKSPREIHKEVVDLEKGKN